MSTDYAAMWCGKPFGLDRITSPEGEEFIAAFGCRRPPGHDGPHSCPASEERGYISPPADMSDAEAVAEWLTT